MTGSSSTYARAGSWSVLAHLAQLVGSVLLSVFVVRSLSIELLGELALGRQLTALLAVVGSLALDRALVRFVPELVERGTPGAVRGLVLALFRFRLLAGAAIAVAAVLARGPIARLVGIQDPTVVVVAAIAALGFSAAAHLRAAANSRFHSRRVAQAAVVAAVLGLGLAVLALQAGYGVIGLLWVASLSIAVGAAWTWPAAVGAAGTDGPQIAPQRLRAYTVPFAAIVILNQLVHSQTEVFFLGRLRGPDEAAWFQYGFVLSQRIIDFLPLALWEVSMAAFATEQVAGGRNLRDACHAYLRISYTAILPVAAIGVVLSPAVIAFLYGEKMESSAMVAQAYFVLGAVVTFGAPMGMVLYAREATALVLKIYVVGTLLNLGLDWWLVGHYGLGGAVAGLAMAKIFLVVAMSLFAARFLGGISIPWKTILRATIASSGAFLWWWIDPGLGGIAGLGAGTFATLLIVLLLYRLLRVVDEADARLLAVAPVPGAAALTRLVAGGGVGGRS